MSNGFDPVRWGIAMREARDNPQSLGDLNLVQRDIAIFEVLLGIEKHLAEIAKKVGTE